MNRLFVASGAVLLAIAVSLGAFGAHALRARLSPEMMQVYKTGIEYHFYHALGLLLVGLLGKYLQSAWYQWSGWLLMGGVVIFSGSLYLLAVTGTRGLGVITPLGGLAFLSGWISLAVAVFKS